ncbi:MAG: Abi family protein [Actinomycetota bacterium]|nr:Abi family protein [Actinomycetota bacterium]
MIYAKPALTLEQQADLLIQRGMTGDRGVIIEHLKTVNYYRLSGYWYPFRDLPGETFRPGTAFDVVWDRYAFDRQLRLLVMDGIERIEVAVRTQLAYHHSHHCGNPFAYADDPTALPSLAADQRDRLLAEISEQTRNSRETFVQHFRAKYGQDHDFMPIWMASEIMTFGSLLTFYRGVAGGVRQSVARLFGVHDTVLDSWLLTLNTIRNICAHHARLWNRQLGVRPKIPGKDTRWHAPVEVTNERVFGILTIIRYCLTRIAPQSRWPDRLRALQAEHPRIPRKAMGFPENWETCAIWKAYR